MNKPNKRTFIFLEDPDDVIPEDHIRLVLHIDDLDKLKWFFEHGYDMLHNAWESTP